MIYYYHICDVSRSLQFHCISLLLSNLRDLAKDFVMKDIFRPLLTLHNIQLKTIFDDGSNNIKIHCNCFQLSSRAIFSYTFLLNVKFYLGDAFLICCTVNENDFEKYVGFEIPNANALKYLETVQSNHFSKMHGVQ
uniref:Uncharacterized protein n=1 Tax=Glossina pallidipes TaxID=7398 RepID=A0A1B0A8K6_GLOPL